MTRPNKAFWWSPRNDIRLSSKEMRTNGMAWLRLAKVTRYPLANFGDELTPLALTYATGRKTQWTPAHRAEIIAVGSIIEYVAKRSTSKPIVWGTGLRDEPDGTSSVRDRFDRFVAVRGNSTRAALGLGEETAIGDPGVLAPELVASAPSRRGTLYLPHFRTWTTSRGLAELDRAKTAGFEIAAPSMRPTEMLRQISGADLVISSSLHGLIVAHAYGVPVQLVTLPPTKRLEPKFKYVDYLDTVGLAHDPIAISELFEPRRLRDLRDQRESEAAPVQSRTVGLANGLVAALESI